MTNSIITKYTSSNTELIHEPSALLTHENGFVQKCIALIQEHIKSPEFGVNELAEHLCLSRTQVYRKIKSTTGLSTTGLIRNIRLEHAKTLIHSNTDLNISEIAYKAGFSSLSYFSTCYAAYFGVPPSQSGE